MKNKFKFFSKILTFCLSLGLILGLGAAQGLAQSKGSGKIVVYNWSEYIPQDVLADFTKETGIEVVYSTFESNEAMIAKIKLMQGKGYDLVVPSSYFIDILEKEGLVQELDHAKIPNLKNIDDRWLNLDFDKGNKYSVPYMWGFVGLTYNSKYVKAEELTQWKDLLNPKLKGKIIMTDDLRDAYCLAMKAKGLACATVEKDEIEKAYDFLLELKPSIRIFDVTATKQAMISEEVWVGPIWNGDFLVAEEENPDLSFAFPKEGAVLWMDTFVIPKGAENVDNAHAFINFMLKPEVAARCVEEFRYSTPNKAAIELLSEEDQKNRVLLPTEEDLKDAEFTEAVGDALPVYQKYWEMLKTAR